MKGRKLLITCLEVLLAICFTNLVLGKDKLGLYDKSDCVIVLNGTNIYKNLIGSNSVWIIEFYNSWCGHCQIFAPKWKEFAKKHTAWRPVIKIAAVDCAFSGNQDVCRKYDVGAFPSFKIFPPYSTVNDLGELYLSQDLDAMRHKLLDFAANITDPPPHWPRLAPIKSMQDVWDEAKEHHQHVAFIFEEADSYIGREVCSNLRLCGKGLIDLKNEDFFMMERIFKQQVILDTSQYKELLVRRMLKDAVQKFVITTFPSMYLINRDGTFTRIAKSDNSKAGMVKSLKDLLSVDEIEAGDQYVKKIEMEMEMNMKESVPSVDTHAKSDGVYMQDLESTLHFMFRQEIAIHRSIEDEKLTALKLFIKVLAKYFPGSQTVTDYLHILENWIKEEMDLTGDHWLNHVDELQTVDKYLPDRVEWVGCKGSQPRYRGYPCGMWTLFHTLTVSAYQTQRQNPKDLPIDILAAIQGYMKYFFGCQTCVHHFLAMANNITTADRTSEGAVMWLWRAHNSANLRLHGDISEDPRHPKVQFPPQYLCKSCYQDTKPVEKNIFEFLVGFYGRDGIIQSESESKEKNEKLVLEHDDKALDWWELQQRRKDLEKIKALRVSKLEKLKQKRKQLRENSNVKDVKVNFEGYEDVKKSGVIQGWGFNRIDIGLCVSFYMMCAVILLVLYYHFIVKKKHRPCQIFLPK